MCLRDFLFLLYIFSSEAHLLRARVPRRDGSALNKTSSQPSVLELPLFPRGDGVSAQLPLPYHPPPSSGPGNVAPPQAAVAPPQASVTPPPAAPMVQQPRIYFLFLAVDKVSNLEVWNAFFQNAPVGSYRALVHCKERTCESQLAGTVLQPVPSVPSYYCTDLVSPMMQLLNVALHDVGGTAANPMDKFAFISDSSLPAKPFNEMYAILSGRHGSSFCVFPSSEWADVPGNSFMDIAIKHHQWVTLDRTHALTAVREWQAGKLHDFMGRFHMNAVGFTSADNSYADHRNFGCLDEFWIMLALYGPISARNDGTTRMLNLTQFYGAPLQIDASAGWQGTCDTFVMWSQHLRAGGLNPFIKFYSKLDPVSIPHSGNVMRPGWWDTVSEAGIQAMRNSDFLFVRKFIDKPTLQGSASPFHEAYTRIVLR